MTGACILLGAALIMAAMLEIDFRHRRRALQVKRSIRRRRLRRCHVSRRDAAWLAGALDDPYCPACDRPLAQHSR